MKKMLLLAGIATVAVLVGGWLSPQNGMKAVGGGNKSASYGMVYGGCEGDQPTIYVNSKLPFLHRVKLAYRHVAGAYALHLGQSDITMTAVSHSFGDSASSVVKEVQLGTGMYDGDSLIVYVTIAAEDSTVLDTLERGYLIDHDVVTLAMGNPYGGADIFNPTGLTITDSIEVDAATFKTAWMRNSGDAWDDTCLVLNGKTVQVLSGFPIYGADYTHLRIPLLWWDFEDLIPDNVTITDAYINLRSDGIDRDVRFAAGEGVVAILDTLSADVPWTQGSVGHCNASKDPLQTSAQISFMSRADQTPWNTAVEMRDGTHKWGIASEMCRTFAPGDTILNANQDIKIDIKDLMQYWVDFHDIRDLRQAGFFIMSRRTASGTNYIWDFQCGVNTTYEEYSPSLVIRYENKKYDDYPWNGKPFVFCMTSDDGHRDALQYAKVMEDRGARMTQFFVQDLPVDLGPPDYMTDAEYLAFYEAGHEVGVQANDNLRMARAADGDSLGWFISRQFIAPILGLVGDDTMKIVSFAYNLGDTLNAPNARAGEGIPLLVDFGYTGARLANDIRLVDPEPRPTLVWDSGADLFKTGKWMWTWIADNDDTADSVRVKQLLQFGQASIRGTPTHGQPIITLSHGGSTSTYAEMDSTALGLAVDEYRRRGDTEILTFGQIQALYRAAHESAGGRIWTLP